MTMLITADALARLLRPVLPFASDDLSRPVLSCVLIETRGTYVSAVATDRFKVGWQRVALDDTYDFKAVVSADTLAALLRIFKPAHGEVPVTLELSVDGDVLTVSQVDHSTPDGFTGASFQARVSTLPFPKLDAVVRGSLGHEASTEPVKFDWRHMVEFAYVDAPDGLFLTTNTGIASVVTNGTDFVGLIHSRRALRDDHTLDDGWDAILAPAPKTEKAGVA